MSKEVAETGSEEKTKGAEMGLVAIDSRYLAVAMGREVLLMFSKGLLILVLPNFQTLVLGKSEIREVEAEGGVVAVVED